MDCIANLSKGIMEAFITALPNNAIGWAGLVIAMIASGFAAYLFYSRQKDGADDRLINILKETVDALEKKVDDQKKEYDNTVGSLTKKIDDLTEKVDELEKENATLIEVLQGRDKATLEFQKQMLEAVKIGMETNGLAKETAHKLGELIDTMKEHLSAVQSAQEKGK